MRFNVALTENNKWIVSVWGSGFEVEDKQWAFSYASEVADFLQEQKKKKDAQPKPYELVKANLDEPPF